MIKFTLALFISYKVLELDYSNSNRDTLDIEYYAYRKWIFFKLFPIQTCVGSSKVGNRPVNMHIDQTSGHYWF